MRTIHGHVYFVSLKGIPTGPESTERFGRGPDPDLARKARFFNFFGQIRPFAHAMECRVDSVHTNFSRRSHPCHPEFLPRGRISRSSPFGFELGSTLGRLWADFGPILGLLWADLGQLEPAEGQLRPSLSQVKANLGPICAEFATKLG